MAVIFEEEGAAREGPAGALDTACDGPGSSGGSETSGETGKRSCTDGTDEDGPGSTGMRVASMGGLVGSADADLWMGDLGTGGGMDGRRGFGL